MLESGFYATPQQEILVVFGGRIILGGASWTDEDGDVVKELSLFEDGLEHEIGENLGEGTDEDYGKYSPIRLRFYDDKSIDTLIKQLNAIKKLGK